MLSFTIRYRAALPIPIREIWFAAAGDRIPRPATVPQALRLFHSDGRIGGMHGRWRQTRTLITRLDRLDALEPTLGSNLRREIRQSADRDGSRVVVDWSPGQLMAFAETFDAANPNRPNLARMRSLASVGGLGIAAAFVDDAALCAHVYIEDAALGVTRLLYSYSARPRKPGSTDADHSAEAARMASLVARTNKALHWRDLERYHQRGFKYYDWGGFTGRPDNGIDRFKLMFRGELAEKWCFDGLAMPGWAYPDREMAKR